MPSGPISSGAGRIVAGRYLLLTRLGAGDEGRVWLAHDRRVSREVALRPVVPGGPARPAPGPWLEAVRRMAGLRGHPHVVAVHDAVVHEDLVWLVMEYVPGAVDLRTLTARRGPAQPAECARIGLAVLDALTAGHRLGLPHGDVRPEHVLLAPDGAGSPYGRVLLTGHRLLTDPEGTARAAAGRPVPGRPATERGSDGVPDAAGDLFALGRTLYHAVEGHGPFDADGAAGRDATGGKDGARGRRKPRPAERAGALGPVLEALLEEAPARRMTAEEAEAALTPLVASYAESAPGPRGGDPGSLPQWAAPPPAPPRGRRRAARLLHSAAACLLGALLAGSGVWYAAARQGEDTGGAARPYGRQAGLTRPLHEGDCVRLRWPGVRFAGTPRVTADPACRGPAPDGQVMALAGAVSAADARERGAARCAALTQELRAKLPDVRSLALPPTEDGFARAGGRVACLVVGARGPVHGPLGAYRRPGDALTHAAHVQRRDCLDLDAARTPRLASCAGRYDEMVLGFATLSADVPPQEAGRAADAACAREVPPRDYGFHPGLYASGSLTGMGAWEPGTRIVVCTVRKRDGGTMQGDDGS